MTTVSEAERIIQSQARDYRTELIPFESALGRVLAEDLVADRDLPPCNRATMDGIAINFNSFEKGIRSFYIKATIAAGDMPVDLETEDQCIEIMTGAALPGSADTVIRYEDVDIQNGTARVTVNGIKKGQNIHRKGKDKKQGETVAPAPQFIDATVISMAASVGKTTLQVRKLPHAVIISTGDELVDVADRPSPYQVRRSNNYTVRAVLQQYCLQADMLHLPDDRSVTRDKIQHCLASYDVIILTGGVSMGKFDYVPQVLEELNVTKHFHKVQQRPGKPFWFGSHANSALVFAFPGNPVSTFLCLHRYFIPWLQTSLLQTPGSKHLTPKYAILDEDVVFTPPLQYFAQVKLNISASGQLLATPVEGNGSGDFANLLDSDAFMELPLEQSNFNKGQVYRIWPFKPLI